MTNKSIINDDVFKHACALAKIIPTKIQAGKFRRGHGAAFQILPLSLQKQVLMKFSFRKGG